MQLCNNKKRVHFGSLKRMFFSNIQLCTAIMNVHVAAKQCDGNKSRHKAGCRRFRTAHFVYIQRHYTNKHYVQQVPSLPFLLTAISFFTNVMRDE